MRTTALFIVSTLIILSFIGCNRVPSYDHRLVAVDSALAHDNPQEAKRLLDSIEDVSGSANRAYHALLQTESNYRNYIDDTTDAVINVALDYYESHQADRHNYVRALMYKGINCNLLGDRLTAIEWLTKADFVCDTTDYFLLGYINERIADLYTEEFNLNRLHIDKYLKAINYFRKANKIRYEVICLTNMGMKLLAHNPDSAFLVMMEAADKASVFDNKNDYYIAQIEIARYYLFFKNDNRKAINILTSIPLSHLPHMNIKELGYLCGRAYALNNQVDSARVYLSLIDGNDADARLKKSCILSVIAETEHNFSDFTKYGNLKWSINDSIIIKSLATNLKEVELKYDKTQVELEASELKNERFVLVIVVLLLLFCCGSIFVWQRQKRLQARAKINEILAEYTCEKIKFDNLAKNNSELHDIASHHFQFIEQILQTINADRITPVKEVDRIHEMMNQYLKNNFDDGFWQKLETFVNTTYDNFCAEVRQKMPRVKDEDIHFLTLEIAQYPSLLILCLMNYTNIQSYHTKKARLKKRLQEHGLYEQYEKCIVATK